jgi:hypothetical protein
LKEVRERERERERDDSHNKKWSLCCDGMNETTAALRTTARNGIEREKKTYVAP